MKTKKMLVKITALSLVLLSGMFLVPSGGTFAEGLPDIATTSVPLATPGTLSVNGTGVVKVKPDIAILNIGVNTRGETTAIQEENTKAMNKVIAAVKALGIDEKDIKTVSYYMNPEYDYSDYKESKIIGYYVYNVVEVKVRKIDNAGKVLSAATEAGANINNGVSFSLSDYDKYYREALVEAIKDAQAKAEAMAGAVGAQVGAPLTLNEGSGYYSAPYSNYNIAPAAEMAMDAYAPVAVAQGELSVTANVYATYDYAR